MTRRVRCWLVCDCTGVWEDYVEYPVRAFDRRESAERCADVRGGRHRRDEDEYSDPIWCRVYETEIVLEEE